MDNILFVRAYKYVINFYFSQNEIMFDVMKSSLQ